MAGPFNQGSIKGWLDILLDIGTKATPVTLVFMMLTGALMGYYGLKELRRVRTMNVTLWENLMTSEREKLVLADEHATRLMQALQHCTPTLYRGE